VRCLSINIFCNLGPRLAYLFIYLFNIEPLSAEPLSASIPLGLSHMLLLLVFIYQCKTIAVYLEKSTFVL
jgi:hypothetical protein